MKRKLVKQGAATLMVSLPSKWARQNNLGKGDEVDVEDVDNNLLISPGELHKISETEIKLQGVQLSSVRNIIANTYRKGYDRISVSFENKKQFDHLSYVIKHGLIGFDIIRKEKNFCVVENITEPSGDQFDNILGKMFMGISTLFEITRRRMNGERVEEDLHEVEERILKYDNFCRRIIIKKKLVEHKSEFFWTFLQLLNYGQRELYHLNTSLGKIKASEKTKDLLQGCEKMFELLKKTYLDKDSDLVGEAHDLQKDVVYKKGYSLLETNKGKENIIVYHLLMSERYFFRAHSPLLGLIL